jgi:predicted kinase
MLESGRIAILDATFGRCRHRAMAAELARELRVPIHIDVADWRDAIHEFARKIA